MSENLNKALNAVGESLTALVDTFGVLRQEIDAMGIENTALRERMSAAAISLTEGIDLHNSTVDKCEAGQATPADVAADRANADKLQREFANVTAEWKETVDTRLDEDKGKLEEHSSYLSTIHDALKLDDNGKSVRIDEVEAALAATAGEVGKVKASIKSVEDRVELLEANSFDVGRAALTGITIGVLTGVVCFVIGWAAFSLSYAFFALVIGLFLGFGVTMIVAFVKPSTNRDAPAPQEEG